MATDSVAADQNAEMIAFFRARMGAAAALARAAGDADPSPWVANADDTDYALARDGNHGAGLVLAADGEPLWNCEGSSTLCMTAPSSRHTAAHHPGAVLADLAAKEKVIRLYEAAISWDARAVQAGWERTVHRAAAVAYLDVVQLHCAAYVSHPEYRPEWAPRV